MSRNPKKIIAKEEYQNKVNPRHKTKYERPLRPRPAVFRSDKDYDRAHNQKELDDACRDAGIFHLR